MRSLSEELKKYGYVFSTRRSLLLYAAAFMGMLALGRFFSLGMVAQIVLFAAGFIMLPFFLRNTFQNRYHQKRFSDLNIYMEQFLYSFQKSGKVLMTLEDLLSIFEAGEMRETIEAAREHIMHTFDEVNVEENALNMIEKAYPYDGLRTIHHFALTSEALGGNYYDSTVLLLESIRMFADRVYALQQEQKIKRREIFLSILTSLFLCSMIFVLSSKIGVDISGHPLSQMITTIVLVFDLFIFYKADKKLTVGFVESDHKADDDYVRQYLRLKEYDDGKLLDRIGKHVAQKSVTREIEKQFPNWLMEVSLLLQTENVPVAIQKSYEMAPKILQPALSEFILDLKEKPDSMEPYMKFLADFSMPEVASSMKMLYSISSGAGGDARLQIADIIRRNQMLYDKAQRLANEDSLAGMQALFLAPQLTGGLKLVVDMILLLVLYLGQQSMSLG